MKENRAVGQVVGGLVIAVIVLLVWLPTGCGNVKEKEVNRQIKSLQTDIGELQSKVGGVKWQITNEIAEREAWQEWGKSNFYSLQSTDRLTMAIVGAFRTVLSDHLDDDAIHLDPNKQQVRATQPPPAAGGQLKESIPASVYNAIAAKAARDWPNNFTMQAFTIKQEVEAYRKLHP